MTTVRASSSPTRAILVTGSAGGFGPEIAISLADRGFRVYAGMADLTHQPALDEMAHQRGVQTLRVVQCDETDADSVGAAIDIIVAECGGVYAVVANATLFIRGYFEDLTPAEARRIVDVNLFGTINVARAALPHMRRAGRGRIVVITSVAARISTLTGSLYSASRFGQDGFAEALYQEIKPLGLHVSTVQPGITKTPAFVAERSAGERTRDPNSPYLTWFERAESLFNRAMDSSPMTTEKVSAVVYRALTTPRPRLRYTVGWRSSLLIILRRRLPEPLFERLYFGAIQRRTVGTSAKPH